jgi:hypothetical protein
MAGGHPRDHGTHSLRISRVPHPRVPAPMALHHTLRGFPPLHDRSRDPLRATDISLSMFSRRQPVAARWYGAVLLCREGPISLCTQLRVTSSSSRSHTSHRGGLDRTFTTTRTFRTFTCATDLPHTTRTLTHSRDTQQATATQLQRHTRLLT